MAANDIAHITHEDEAWVYAEYLDGTQQYSYRPEPPVKWPTRHFIERVVGEKSRRKRWAIVDRRPNDVRDGSMYPPKIAGPFKDIDSAKAAYIMMMTAGSI